MNSNLIFVRNRQENCCSICASTPGCKGFAWNSYEGGTCWLKVTVDKLTKRRRWKNYLSQAGTGPLIYKEGVNVGILSGSSGGGNNGGSYFNTPSKHYNIWLKLSQQLWYPLTNSLMLSSTPMDIHVRTMHNTMLSSKDYRKDSSQRNKKLPWP